MMSTLMLRVNQIIPVLEREYRVPVLTALQNSQGDIEKFEQELDAMVWDYPDLDLSYIFSRINC
jgi:hypothetical protein